MLAKTKSCAGIIAGVWLLVCAATVQAQDVEPWFYVPEPGPGSELPQAVYKGVVGNLLDAVPIDPEKRVTLQRGNAVVSNVSTARTIAGLLGLTNPVLLIGGLLWGLWSASQIRGPETPSAEVKPVQVAARPQDNLCVDVGDPEPVNLVVN